MPYTMPTTNLQPVEEYTARIYDDDLEWVAEYNDYQSLTWIRRWRKPGEFRLQVSRYNADGSERDIQVGYYVSMYRGGEARIGRIKSRQIGLDDRGKESEIWDISGPDAKGILTSRVSLAGVSAGTGYDIQAAVAAETAILHYIDRNVINALNAAGAADADRVISEFVLEADAAQGGNISYQARLQKLTDDIEAILLASSGIGYEVEFLRASKQFEVHIKAGTDKSATVQYNTGFGNIRTISYSENDNAVVNLAYVGGTGTANTRTISTIPAAAPPTGLSRYESFVDGSCTDNSANQLAALGNAEIADKGSSETMTFEIIDDNSFRYMSRDAAGDYDLGDIIKAVYVGIATMSARIIEVREDYGGNAAGHVTLTMGTEIPDMNKIVKSVNTKASTRGRV